MEAVAKLKNAPYPARKMRLLADLIRGKNVDEALTVLKFHPKKMYSVHVEKLVLSAIANWQVKHEDTKMDENSLYIKHISVDNARQLKRIRPAPQGRAHRILKRFSHINLIIDTKAELEDLMDDIMSNEAEVKEQTSSKKGKQQTKKKEKLTVAKTEKTENVDKAEKDNEPKEDTK